MSLRKSSRRKCVLCGGGIPATIKVDGKKRVLSNRTKCLDCLPFKHAGVLEIPEEKGLHKHCVICKTKGRVRICRSCRTKMHRMRMKIAAVRLLGGKCKDCGWDGSVVGFDFHHSSGDKDFAISSASYKAWSSVKKELKKCVLLCAVCHRIRHSDRTEELIKEAEKNLGFYS
jgi:hypothetical protein